MKTIATLTMLVSALAIQAGSVKANELDPSTDLAPQGVIVREKTDGSKEVFKASLGRNIVESDAAAADAISTNVKPENKIENIAPLDELDQVSSDNSWRSWYSRYGSGYRSGYSDGYRDGYRDGYYGYSYSSYGRSYDYYPSYSYYRGGYSYHYYYSHHHYGYRGCYGRY